MASDAVAILLAIIADTTLSVRFSHMEFAK